VAEMSLIGSSLVVTAITETGCGLRPIVHLHIDRSQIPGPTPPQSYLVGFQSEGNL
jgi:hypothetical protein